MSGILVVSTSYPADVAGAEAAGSFVADFSAELSRSLPVTVCAPAARPSRTRVGNLVVWRFGVPTERPLSLLNPLRPKDLILVSQVLRAGLRAVLEAAEEMRPDHALACWALPSGYWARQLKRRSGVPYSVWALGSDIWSLGRLPLVRGTLRSVIREASGVYADGLLLLREVEAISKRSCQFLPSSRQLAGDAQPDPPPLSPPYRLAFLGRFHPNKGVDLLLDALLRLAPEDWAQIEAVRVAGGGPLLDEVSRRIDGLAKQGRPIRLEGYKSPDEARALLSWSHLVLIPSRIESIPVVFSDAMQLGRAVLAMPVGDLPDLIRRYGVGACAEHVTAESFALLLKSDRLKRAAACAPATRAASLDFDVRRTAHGFLQRSGLVS